MDWWVWVIVALVLLTIEFFSTTMHIGFFAVGAFLVAILVGLGVAGPLWAQLLTFAITSVIALAFVRPIVVRRLGLSRTVVVDTMIGEEAIAMGEIAPSSIGKAELRGSTWSARNVGETTLAAGQRCTVERIDGLLLHVKAQ
jgi:membrane protein implicated in regulation of membrane protease activity